MNKNNLRKVLKNYSVDREKKQNEENFLLQALWEKIVQTRPICIGLYSAIQAEFDLSAIFLKCKELGILTAYPRITDDQITFHMIDSLVELSEKTHGICEPRQNAPLIIPDLVIVPGLAFTKKGKRLGRGKGHYDRYLSQYAPHTISLVFSWQLFEDLPTEPHDVQIDQVLSMVSK